MCTIVYYNNPKTPEEEAVTREQGQANANTGEKFGRPNEPIHPPDWIANTNGNQKRKRWIERLRELDYPGFV